jgi:hypothetical protein
MSVTFDRQSMLTDTRNISALSTPHSSPRTAQRKIPLAMRRAICIAAKCVAAKCLTAMVDDVRAAAHGRSSDARPINL